MSIDLVIFGGFQHPRFPRTCGRSERLTVAYTLKSLDLETLSAVAVSKQRTLNWLFRKITGCERTCITGCSTELSGSGVQLFTR
jgi:hypothetical protein